MKKFIKSFIPPILIDFYNRIKLKATNDAPTSFTGVFDKPSSVACESPWVQKRWISIQENRLKALLSADSKIIASNLAEFEAVPCYLINALSQEAHVNIIDIGGGSGLTFFKFLPYFKNPSNVNYHVVDYGKIALTGKRFSEKIEQVFNLNFHDDISSVPKLAIDIVFCSSSIQFIYEYERFIVDLVNRAPTYFVMTQVPVGGFDTYYTAENQHGYITPRIMFSHKEFVNIFQHNGYAVEFEWPVNEYYPNSFFRKIPHDLRIRNSTSFIFKKVD